VKAWLMRIPVTVLPDGSNLRLSQFVVGILVLTAAVLLWRDQPIAALTSAANFKPQAMQELHDDEQTNFDRLRHPRWQYQRSRPIHRAIPD